MTISLHTVEAWVSEVTVPVISTSITMDESWSPYIQGTITTPFDATLLNSLDPRTGGRIRIYATQTYGLSELVSVLSDAFGTHTVATVTAAWNGDTVADISESYFTPFNSSGVNYNYRRRFDLAIRARTIDPASETITLEVSSDEALLQDYALVNTVPYVPTFFNVRTIVAYVLNLIGRSLVPGAADGTVAADAVRWEPGQTAWDYIQPLIQSAGLRLYSDESRRWYLIERGATNPGLVALEATGTITGASDSISRNDDLWFDAVVITYKWVNDLGVTVIDYDVAAADPFSKVVHFEYDTAYPGAGAAQLILDRATSRGRVNTVNAVSDYRVLPATACTVSLTGLPTQSGYVSAVTWNYPDDEMSVKTRTT